MKDKGLEKCITEDESIQELSDDSISNVTGGVGRMRNVFLSQCPQCGGELTEDRKVLDEENNGWKRVYTVIKYSCNSCSFTNEVKL